MVKKKMRRDSGTNLHFTEICNLNQDDLTAVIREVWLCVHIYGERWGVNFNVVL
jgi:hypothetical protein